MHGLQQLRNFATALFWDNPHCSRHSSSSTVCSPQLLTVTLLVSVTAVETNAIMSWFLRLLGSAGKVVQVKPLIDTVSRHRHSDHNQLVTESIKLALLDKMHWQSLSFRFNGHFPGEPGLAGVYWSRGWWRWWWQLDYRSYKSCKAPVKS